MKYWGTTLKTIIIFLHILQHYFDPWNYVPPQKKRKTHQEYNTFVLKDDFHENWCGEKKFGRKFFFLSWFTVLNRMEQKQLPKNLEKVENMILKMTLVKWQLTFVPRIKLLYSYKSLFFIFRYLQGSSENTSVFISTPAEWLHFTFSDTQHEFHKQLIMKA